MGKVAKIFGGSPKVDTSAADRAREEAEAERRRLEAERESTKRAALAPGGTRFSLINPSTGERGVTASLGAGSRAPRRGGSRSA
ncbi:MAG: hypothetical protein QNJ94_18765 [Alphaproteobacteria bacterium]|nr:hypothetical protein [Alphaproteobacteria bacterium]